MASPDKTPRWKDETGEAPSYERLQLAYEAAIAQRNRYRSAHAGLEAEVVRLREAQRQATHYLESYCEATDPDPRADDDEEITVPDAYVLSALAALAEGVASPDKPPGGEGR